MTKQTAAILADFNRRTRNGTCLKPCPICGQTYHDGGTGYICDYCGWEIDDPDEQGRYIANEGLTDREARANFDLMGAISNHCARFAKGTKKRFGFNL